MTKKIINIESGPERLKSFEDNWQTEMGAWFPGERVVLRGKDVFTELSQCSWMEYFIYGLTGKTSTKLARLVEGIWLISTNKGINRFFISSDKKTRRGQAPRKNYS